MKPFAIFAFLLLSAIPALAGPRVYQSGKVLSFDTGQVQKGSKHAAKDEVVYQVQVGSVVYKVTNHTKKHEFSADQIVQCRTDKTHLYIEKEKGGEVKYDIVGEVASAH